MKRCALLDDISIVFPVLAAGEEARKMRERAALRQKEPFILPWAQDSRYLGFNPSHRLFLMYRYTFNRSRQCVALSFFLFFFFFLFGFILPVAIENWSRFFFCRWFVEISRTRTRGDYRSPETRKEKYAIENWELTFGAYDHDTSIYINYIIYIYIYILTIIFSATMEVKRSRTLEYHHTKYII